MWDKFCGLVEVSDKQASKQVDSSFYFSDF